MDKEIIEVDHWHEAKKVLIEDEYLTTREIDRALECLLMAGFEITSPNSKTQTNG